MMEIFLGLSAARGIFDGPHDQDEMYMLYSECTLYIHLYLLIYQLLLYQIVLEQNIHGPRSLYCRG